MECKGKGWKVISKRKLKVFLEIAFQPDLSEGKWPEIKAKMLADQSFFSTDPPLLSDLFTVAAP